jgi:hypothetical protein
MRFVEIGEDGDEAVANGDQRQQDTGKQSQVEVHCRSPL